MRRRRTDLEHIRPGSLHNPDPALRTPERIFPLRRALRPAFKVAERLQDQDLEALGIALGLDDLGGGAEVIVVVGADFLAEVQAGEGQQVREAELDGLEAGGGDGVELLGEGVLFAVADGDAGVGDRNGLEGFQIECHSLL